jgi:hypothetical protein
VKRWLVKHNTSELVMTDMVPMISSMAYLEEIYSECIVSV